MAPFHEHSQIIDDGYKHSLLVYRDSRTGGIRLQAAAWDGELRRCPVWTAFSACPSPSIISATPLPRKVRRLTYVCLVTHICTSPTWLVPVAKHLVLVKDIQLYVFCQKYRESKMRQNKSGAFEIYFVGEQGA